ncbi:MAG TPA: hypothetical protein VMX12_08290 [Acidimicrobiia bacterium]|nr:hypothetical protein [Acidimicrobiia bacterium]
MKSTGGQLERSAIKSRSAKRSKLMATERAPLVRDLRAAGVRCEVCPRIDAAGIRVQCTGEVQGIHERRKRSSAGSLVVAENLIPSCDWGNGWIEDRYPLLSVDIRRALFGSSLVVREGDEEWERLGVRAEPTPVVVLTCDVCGDAYVTLHTGCG